MFTETPTVELLFKQLGLDDSEQAITDFIKNNQLPEGVKLADAPCWSAGQAQFLREKWHGDDEWAPFIDWLNTELHKDCKPNC